MITRLVLVGAFIAALNPQTPPVHNRVGLLSQLTTATVAPPEIEALVRQALEDRLKAGDLPDINLLRGYTKVAILDELRTTKMKLGPAALPKREGYEFYLISAATAQTTADSSGKLVHFLTVDSPNINGETATVRLGTDVAFPQQPNLGKMCCCSARGEFRRVSDRWTFVKWTEFICS